MWYYIYMNYYNYEKDIFYDDEGYLIIDVRDICEWYFPRQKREIKFKFGYHSQNCKIVYKTLLNSIKKGIPQISPYNVPNFLIEIFKRKFLSQNDMFCPNAIHSSIYTPKVVREGEDIGLYINLLSKDDVLLDTLFTNSKYTYSVDTENYFRLKLGLMYYLLGIEKDYGYLIHCSFKSAIRTIRIDRVFTHEQCKKIIENYFKVNRIRRKADIKKEDIIYAEIINDLPKLKLLS